MNLSDKFKDQKGQGLTEYVIILALVAVTAMLALKGFSKSLNILFGQVTTAMHGKTYDGPKFDEVEDILQESTKSHDLSNFDEQD